MALTGGDVVLDRGHDGRVAYLTLSHGKYTVVTMEMRRLVAERFAEIDKDPQVKVVVVRSDGQHFTSGGDIAGFMEVDPIDLTDLGHDVTAPARSTKPVIAAIDGYCFGVGLEMVLSCDIRLGTGRTQLALPEMNLGMIPGSGGTQRLARLIGLSRAKFHIMTATRIQARQALDWGILSGELHDDRDALYAAVDELALKMAGFSPAALRTAKEVLDRGVDGPLYTGIELERKAYSMLRATEDFAEGVKAFGEKRAAEFTGR
ncbi:MULTISPECIES: enoyl-CoA hydratase/isomerase family protein [Pseudonocardia]|uniref:2,3-dehydroadipyl-CoA hydratase n=2 Tax=Pseudonocardia TaxID=1847 RepID=A0A1Y2MQB1_PSEAH|nr:MULTISPECIES: enoyl-CoA hydratase/isomerase family protein [Pseudonocardia]OSY37169.1 2,3-dehydroadipyl-CoA hydratase [Pseudonocardia autotrophica]TDN74790.1 2-oxoglutaroyl-CoA hydrolase [Pseudonocardia autotrophica]BBG05565.1 crotonase [Pseudonocardia autotrophica]GEC25816.1 crotonase [Pseudonocardia saturnea]